MRPDWRALTTACCLSADKSSRAATRATNPMMAAVWAPLTPPDFR